MSSNRTPLVQGVKEHLLLGNPITHLECIVIFGVPGLTKVISDLRKEGYVINKRRVPFVAAMRRINEHAVLQAPPNLPVKEVFLTEFWVSR
jgi:hypothetical protein